MSLSTFEIEELIVRYIKNELTDVERAALEEWVSVNDENRKLFEELINVDALRPDLSDYNFYETRKSNAKKKLNALLLMTVPVVPVKRSWFKWVAAASVATVVVTGGVYLLMKQGNKQELVKTTPAPVEDIPPGGDKAILTLADGTTVVLENSQNGIIGKQGNVEVVKKDGEVRYDVKGKPSEVAFNTLATQRGGQYKLMLPDGSKVWLNAASSIKYPVAFVGKERKVEITGEVYFEVVKNERMPFRVLVFRPRGTRIDAKAEVQVLGTRFNINSYHDEPEIMTTLVEGKVTITNSPGSGSNSTTLKPGQQAQINLSGNVHVKNVNAEYFIAWKNGYFNFKHERLSKVLRDISRWYNIDIRYATNISDIELSGNIERKANLSEVLKILSFLQIKYELNGSTIFIKGN